MAAPGMSIASSSSSSASALRSTVRPTRLASESRTPPYRRLRVLHDPPRRRLPPVHPLQVLIGAPYSLARHYTPLPAYREPDDPPTYRQPPRPVPIQSRYPQFNITPESAQTYLSDLLQLPPSRAFPPALALQILTHKSYRFVHLAKHHPSPASSASPSSSLSQSPSPMAELDEWASNHNSRLTFLGRRAIASYLAMFIHSCISSTISVRSLDFLRGKGLDGKLEEMRVVQNIGRSVGDPWRVDEVMRWDRNTVSRSFFTQFQVQS